MFIRRGNQAAVAASSRERSAKARNSSKEPPRAEVEYAAAVKIQSIWRGRQERLGWQKRRFRKKPWGYFTHTLTLTYISSVWNPEQASARKRLYELLEEPGSSTLAFGLSIFIVTTIVVSIVVFLLETVPAALHGNATLLWFSAEIWCTAVFTLEYGLRLSVCGEGGMSRIRFLVTPMNVFDLCAVLPFYFDFIMKAAGIGNTVILRMSRMVRLTRLMRIFKLGRYASGIRLMGEALRNSSQAISVLVFLLCMGVVLFSSALYHMERLSCPTHVMSAAQLAEYDAECDDPYNRGYSPKYGLCCTLDGAPLDFPSIVAASWWSMATMTSVGYGDIYPRTVLGKCVGFVAMLVGMVLIALPVAIVGQKFQDVYDRRDLEEAKLRAASRMKAEGKTWALAPASDVVQKLKQLSIKDPVLAGSIAGLASGLEDVWEQREQLGRLRKIEFDHQDAFSKKAENTLEGMYSVSCGTSWTSGQRRLSKS
mmetsp:Transcript_72959/g.165460  ORF Transcript_72959/g.165460 Transcript_72959/m.165460 type:complete len:481 (-) Transcript_72959:76-1518(-)